MNNFIPITAAAALFALASAGSASALEENAAELNFRSTTPDFTESNTLADSQTPVLRLHGGVQGPTNSTATARERSNGLELRNGPDGGRHDLPAGFSIERHVPAD